MGLEQKLGVVTIPQKIDAEPSFFPIAFPGSEILNEKETFDEAVVYWTPIFVEFGGEKIVPAATQLLLQLYKNGLYPHCKITASIAGAASVRLGCTPEEVPAAMLAGLFHDIGKINTDVRDKIKHNRLLSDAERAVMQRHPELGVELVSKAFSPLIETNNLDQLSLGEVLWGILGHHLNVNGSGYPVNINTAYKAYEGQGVTIPRIALVLRVVDSLVAMMENREYKEKKDIRRFWNAVNELRSKAGIWYDSEVLEAVISAAHLQLWEPLPVPIVPITTKQRPLHSISRRKV